LARARFSHDADALAGKDVEIDAVDRLHDPAVDAKMHPDVARAEQGQAGRHQPSSLGAVADARGLNISVTPSANMLKPSTATQIARRENTLTPHASWRNSWPRFSISPKRGAGGSDGRRKPRPASIKIAVLASSATWTMTVGKALGRISLKM